MGERAREEDLVAIRNHIKMLWRQRQGVSSTLRMYGAKHADFLPCVDPLIRYLEEVTNALKTVYLALGGSTKELQQD